MSGGLDEHEEDGQKEKGREKEQEEEEEVEDDNDSFMDPPAASSQQSSSKDKYESLSTPDTGGSGPTPSRRRTPRISARESRR